MLLTLVDSLFMFWMICLEYPWCGVSLKSPSNRDDALQGIAMFIYYSQYVWPFLGTDFTPNMKTHWRFIIFSFSLVNCACKLFQRRSTHLEKRWPSKCWSRWTSNAKCWCLWCLGGSARISEGEGFPCFLGGPVVWFDWNLRESFPVFLFDIYPIESIHGIVTYIYHQNQPNVGKYTIHGSYGYWKGVWDWVRFFVAANTS